MTRYLSGLCVAGLGLCGGSWLVAAVAFGGESAGLAGRVNLLTGAVLIAVCCLSLVCWSSAWQQRMRVDGVLVSRRTARRNRKELDRDVRRAVKLAERSARDARRAAPLLAASGSQPALGEQQRSARDAWRAAPLLAASGSQPALGEQQRSARDARRAAPLLAASGSQPALGEQQRSARDAWRAAPLLAASGSQPALGEQQRSARDASSAAPLPAATGSQPALDEPAGVPSWALPQRTPAASAFRPGSVAALVPAPRGPLPHGAPIDSKEEWR
jgi:hypothetical protein